MMNTRMLAAVSVVGIWLGGVHTPAEARTMAPPIPPASWVIGSAEYTGKVVDRIAKLQGVLTITILQDGWVHVPLTLSGATVTDVELIRKSGEAHIVPDPAMSGSYLLAASRKGTYKVRVEFSLRLYQDSQYEGLRMGIPQASFSTLTLSVPRKDVELREADQLYVERRPDGKTGGVTLQASMAAAHQLDVRWRTKPSAPVKLEPVLYGEIATLVVLQEQAARITAIVDYRIAQGEVKSLTLQVPMGIQVLNVRGAGIEDWRLRASDGHQALEVALSVTLKDTTYRLVMEGEHALQTKQPAYAVPEFILAGVKQERGQVAIAAEGNLEVAADTMDGLTRIDVKELSETLRSSTITPLLLAFRYHQHPYRATVALTHYDDLPVLNAIAEQGNLVTVLSREGERLTRAAYGIRANKTQFLGVMLPSGATLWSCLVDGRSVKPVDGPEQELLIPLATTGPADQLIMVELVYFEREGALAGMGELQLQGPTLEIPTTIANWVVYAPAHMKWLRTSGNVDRGLSPAAFVDDPALHAIAADSTNARARKAQKRMFRSATAHALLEDGDIEQHNEPENMAMELATPVPQGMESGILPLRIRVPKAGRMHHFSRLMTAGEALTVRASYVTLPTWLPFLF